MLAHDDKGASARPGLAYEQRARHAVPLQTIRRQNRFSTRPVYRTSSRQIVPDMRSGRYPRRGGCHPWASLGAISGSSSGPFASYHAGLAYEQRARHAVPLHTFVRPTAMARGQFIERLPGTLSPTCARVATRAVGVATPWASLGTISGYSSGPFASYHARLAFQQRARHAVPLHTVRTPKCVSTGPVDRTPAG